MSVEIPTTLARQLGANRVISVYLPAPSPEVEPRNVFQVVNRCFQILQPRSEDRWRSETDLVIVPDVCGMDWNAFEQGPRLIETGEAAARAVLPQIQEWFARLQCRAA